MRYIIGKEGLKLLKLTSQEAAPVLASDKVITNEVLHFITVDLATAVLTSEQVAKLKAAKIFCEEEKLQKAGLLIDRAYEKARTGWFRAKQRKANVVDVVDIAVMDTGSNLTYYAGYNFVSNSTNVADDFPGGHGTNSHATIQSTQIGLLEGARIHVLKIIDNNGAFFTSSAIAAYDYCLTNNIKYINNSFAGNIPNHQEVVYTLAANNCMIVASAGNSFVENNLVIPAALLKVTAVSSISSDGVPYHKNWIPQYENKGVDFLYGGRNSEWLTSGLVVAASSGTSLSAPGGLAMLAIDRSMLMKIDPVKWNNVFTCMEYTKGNCSPVNPIDKTGAGTFNI